MKSSRYERVSQVALVVKKTCLPLQETYVHTWASLVAQLVINTLANAGDTRDTSLIPVSGRSPGGGNSNPFQYSCLKNPMGRGAWWAAVHGVTKESDTTEHAAH